MANKYACICKFCGKEFSSPDMMKDVCNTKKCQERFKLSLKHKGKSRFSIEEVERRAIDESVRLNKTVTYGQMSLLLDTGIKVF